MTRRNSLLAGIALGFAALGAQMAPASAQDVVKVGLILPMTGPFASTGKQIDAAVKLYMAEHGATAGGKKIEVILRDDASVPDATKRLAQELVVNDHVSALAGFGLTPLAFAAAPIATAAKVPEIVMAAATASITTASPFIVRASNAIPQISMPMAEWAVKNGITKVVTIVSDYGPGIDAAKWFDAPFTKAGGQILADIRVPLANPDFSPFLQRAADLKPDAIFIFVPSGVGAIFMKQFVERGLEKSGIKLIGTGDVVDDDILNGMGDAALGTITAHAYSADHQSPQNQKFVADFEKANAGMRPNFMAAQGYDGVALIYQALAATKGNTDGTTLVNAMKGMEWVSPRGPVKIDPNTREMIQNVYIRKVERKNGQLYNVEIATFPAVNDPSKSN